MYWQSKCSTNSDRNCFKGICVTETGGMLSLFLRETTWLSFIICISRCFMLCDCSSHPNRVMSTERQRSMNSCEQPFNLRMACGRSSKSKSPFRSVIQNDGIPFSHPLLKPSTSSNMLCKAQHVSHTLSAACVECNRIPVFRMRHRLLSIPKVHSTSFLSDSNH